ncbi:hypothetical protein Phum_PHUM354820 [Pediculus humanus corporis]|uniref:Uncharacterized protein n=1 Tax=Pediculus humanus subsp. corporis TaxID=121224 RepID=E0VP95_PEDHC|nr:uncharacterized protein Phum_PHUM354820 [Pediculus humanus corporis]EEB15201.1 hypothetical protein Phum_PHUM354820 [Pediculus humanus corporis]
MMGDDTGKKMECNGQPLKKKCKKKTFGKKTFATEQRPLKQEKLNVNERPIRKKKKTKKYESYERRNGKSPEPEIQHETNLLLALGLTPIKKDDEGNEENNEYYFVYVIILKKKNSIVYHAAKKFNLFVNAFVKNVTEIKNQIRK